MLFFRTVGNNLTEAESLESVSSSASSIAAQLHSNRAASLTQARLIMHQREMSGSPSPRLARSNSVRLVIYFFFENFHFILLY